jgi:hypothetical protein
MVDELGIDAVGAPLFEVQGRGTYCENFIIPALSLRPAAVVREPLQVIAEFKTVLILAGNV